MISIISTAGLLRHMHPRLSACPYSFPIWNQSQSFAGAVTLELQAI